MALGALTISPGMTPLSMGGDRGTKKDPIVITPGRERLKVEKDNQDRLASIGERLLEAISGQQSQGTQPKALTASQKANARDKKIGKSDVKSDLAEDRKIMTDTLKDAFGGIDGKEGMKDSLKMFLLASGLFALFKFGDQISGFLAPVLGFIKKTLIPALKGLFDVFVKNPLGLAPFVVVASLGLKAIGRYFKMLSGTFKFFMAATKDGGKLTKGLTQGFSKSQKAIAGFVNGIRSLFPPLNALGKVNKTTSALGKLVSGSMKVFSTFMKGISSVFSIFGKLSGLSKVFGVALKFARAIPGLGQIIMIIQGIFGAVTGFIEGFKSGGIIGGIVGGLKGIYDAIVGSLLNLLKDLAGWFFGILGFEKLSGFISNLDFSWDGISSAITGAIDKIKEKFASITGAIPAAIEMVTSTIRDAIDSVLDKIKGAANLVIKGINKVRGIVGKDPIPEFELSGERKAREEAEAASTSMTDAQLTGETVPLPAVVSGEVQTASGRDPIEDFNPDVAATGDNVFGMSDRNKKRAIFERIREENPDMKGGDVARLAKTEFTQSQKLAEAQAESPAKGGGVVVVNNSTSNNTNNSNSTTQNMGNMLGSTHSDPTQDLLSKANI